MHEGTESDGPGGPRTTPNHKRAKLSELSCSSQPPWRRANDKTPFTQATHCWICGYIIKHKNAHHFDCCGRKSHNKCLLNQPSSPHIPVCSNVVNYMKRDSRTPDLKVTFAKPVREKSKQARELATAQAVAHKLNCTVCDKQISTADPRMMRNHLKYECTSIPFTPLKKDHSRKQLVYRLAALGTLKKLNIPCSTERCVVKDDRAKRQ